MKEHSSRLLPASMAPIHRGVRKGSYIGYNKTTRPVPTCGQLCLLVKPSTHEYRDGVGVGVGVKDGLGDLGLTLS